MTVAHKLRDKKILLCPEEIAGNMQLIAEELRRRGFYATAASYNAHGYLGYVNDIHLNLQSTKGRLKRHMQTLTFTLWAITNYDIFHFFFGRSLYGLRRFPHLDLRVLHKLGKRIFVHFRGSDVIGKPYRDYLRYKVIDAELYEPPISNPQQRRKIDIWRAYADRVLVSFPLLFKAVPDAVMVKQAINLEYWRPNSTSTESPNDGIIRVVHAPTNREKKGTEFILRSINALKRQGYPVEIELIENIPHKKVKQLYEICDIGVDQVLCGWYGNTSIELMALGKPVICNIDQELRHHASDLPILSADPKTLTEKLKELVENKQLRSELGQKGIDYVKKNHDVKVIADRCISIYEGNL